MAKVGSVSELRWLKVVFSSHSLQGRVEGTPGDAGSGNVCVCLFVCRGTGVAGPHHSEDRDLTPLDWFALYDGFGSNVLPPTSTPALPLVPLCCANDTDLCPPVAASGENLKPLLSPTPGDGPGKLEAWCFV